MQVTIQSIPASLQEFETLAAGGRQPERICALFLCALALFDKDRDAGTAAMNLLRGPRPMTPYDAQFLRDRLRPGDRDARGAPGSTPLDPGRRMGSCGPYSRPRGGRRRWTC